MAQVIERSSKELKIRGVLSNGHALPLPQAAHDVAELFASDVGRLLSEYAPGLPYDVVFRAVQDALENRLNVMLTPLPEPEKSSLRSLPVTNLKPSQVVEHGKLRVSLASLYRYVEADKFYCVVPYGQKNGREFPAWQFQSPVPEVLPDVLQALRGALRTEVHAFLVSSQPSLNDLAPAEVLAGTAFETRPSLHESQVRILTLPAMERKARVLALLNDREDVWPPNG